MIKACIFDLDGVIVDTAKYHFLAWRKMANALGSDFDEHQNEQLKGVSRKESLELILKWGGVELPENEKEEWMEKKNIWYLEYIEQMTPDEIMPGTTRFLGELKANGYKIGLGSASKNSRLILEKIGLLSYFDVIIDGTKTTRSKPDPEVFLLGASALGLSSSECIVFEDAAKGVEAAIRGGFFAVGIGTEENLPEADLVIPSLDGASASERGITVGQLVL